jgi:hypothetical protein
MKSFEQAGRRIVQHIVEAVNDEDDFDPKEVYDTEPSKDWVQIDGDWGDPWVYGGSWFNQARSEILHFDGIENKAGEIDPEMVEVPETMLAKLPPEQPDWHDNFERDEAIEWYQRAKAEFLNARRKHVFYIIPVDMEDTKVPSWLKKYDNPNELEDWDEWPLPQKLIEIGEYIGMHEVGEPIKLTHLEARKYLGKPDL